MPAMPDLSVQLYSVREPLSKDFSGTLGRLADIGLTQVEPYGLLDNADNLRSGLAAHGMTAPTTHQALDTRESGRDLPDRSRTRRRHRYPPLHSG